MDLLERQGEITEEEFSEMKKLSQEELVALVIGLNRQWYQLLEGLEESHRQDLKRLEERLTRDFREKLAIMRESHTGELSHLEKIFDIHTRKKPLGKKVRLSKLALATETLTGSDIEFICRKAAMLAIRSLIEQNKGKQDEIAGNVVILEQHFEEAISLVLKQNSTKK